MWNLQTHSEKEDSAWLSHVCMLFSDLPTRKRPPFGGIRNPTSEPQWRFFLFGMSVHVIFCLNWWNLKGKDSVCKICFNFFFQPTNQSTTASCSAKMFFFFVEVMMNWTMFCMVASPQPRSAKLRHCQWTLHDMPRLWVVLNCKIFVYTSVS